MAALDGPKIVTPPPALLFGFERPRPFGAGVFDRHGFGTGIEAGVVSGDASAGVASRHLKGPGN
jgi:hypothetical protein